MMSNPQLACPECDNNSIEVIFYEYTPAQRGSNGVWEPPLEDVDWVRHCECELHEDVLYELCCEAARDYDPMDIY